MYFFQRVNEWIGQKNERHIIDPHDLKLFKDSHLADKMKDRSTLSMFSSF